MGATMERPRLDMIATRESRSLRMATATYVYCLIAARRRPSLMHMPPGLPGMGPVRLLDVDLALTGGVRAWLAVSDAPLARYDEASINRRLSNLGWVSRAAVAHEAVVESLLGGGAVLPMKLFTIFRSDRRALEHTESEKRRIRSVLKRVTGHEEWAVRVALSPERAPAKAEAPKNAGAPPSGAAYLVRKKLQRDASAELAGHARRKVSALFTRMAREATAAKRRAAADRSVERGALLLDAAFLVRRSRIARFRALARREASVLEAAGYVLTLSGPWPPYSFVQD